MTGEGAFFVDTNVLLYLLDSGDRDRQRRADRWMTMLWENGSGRVSWQVLNEFYQNATRKLGAQPRSVRPVVQQLAHWQPVGFGIGLIERAWHWSDRAGLSYSDALILSAAEYSGCRYLLSEDFQEDRDFGGIRVINPFRAEPPSRL